MNNITSHHKILLIVCMTMIMLCIYGCISVMPKFPYDEYLRLQQSLTSNSVKRTNTGYYMLSVYKIKMKYARTDLFKFSAVKESQDAEKVDSLFLYFVDDYRFYYSRKKKDSIDIAEDIGKGTRLGVYQVNEKVKKADSLITMITLHSATSKVTNANQFEFANIYLELTADNRLKFLTAEYPLKMENRNLPNIQTSATAFTASYLESVMNKLTMDINRHYEAHDMGFHAEWEYCDKPIKTFIKGKPFDQVQYITSQHITRKYFYKKEVQEEEILSENPKESKRITW